MLKQKKKIIKSKRKENGIICAIINGNEIVTSIFNLESYLRLPARAIEQTLI